MSIGNELNSDKHRHAHSHRQTHIDAHTQSHMHAYTNRQTHKHNTVRGGRRNFVALINYFTFLHMYTERERDRQTLIYLSIYPLSISFFLSNPLSLFSIFFFFLSFFLSSTPFICILTSFFVSFYPSLSLSIYLFLSIIPPLSLFSPFLLSFFLSSAALSIHTYICFFLISLVLYA